MSVTRESVRKSSVVLANAAQLSTAILKKVVGNDIASTLGGSPITNNTLRTLAVSRIKKRLSEA